MSELPEELRERFMRFVSKNENGCWEWTGSRYPPGYGQFYDGKNFRAHRWAIEHLAGKKIPNGHFVCHRCDNPPCVNPDHLFVATQRENMADSKAKGRYHYQRNPGGLKKIHLAGEAHPETKLDLANTIAIIREYRDGVSARALGKKYGVDHNRVTKLNRGETSLARAALAKLREKRT